MTKIRIVFVLAIGLLLVASCASNKPAQDERHGLLILSDEELKNVPSTAEEVQPLEVGDRAPSAMVETIGGQSVDLRKLATRQPSVLIFYRGGWCPYCNAHLGKLKEAEPELLAMGYQILAVSPDKPLYLKETLRDKKIDYTLLSDSAMRASRAYGLAFRVDQETRKKYKEYGIDLAEHSGAAHFLLPVPAAYIIDTSGTIRFVYYNADYKVRVGMQELLKAASDIKQERE